MEAPPETPTEETFKLPTSATPMEVPLDTPSRMPTRAVPGTEGRRANGSAVQGAV